METFDAIRSRRSIHLFEEREVEHEKIGALLEAIRWAPSARNRQPWEIIVVDDQEKIDNLADNALEQSWMEDAPLVFVVCINQKMAEGIHGVRGKNLYAIQATAAAIQNMMLAAQDMGLGTCWVDTYDEEIATEILDCPEHVMPISMVAVGYPAENPDAPERHDITSFSYYNSYGKQMEFEWKGVKEHAKNFKKRLLKSLEKY